MNRLAILFAFVAVVVAVDGMATTCDITELPSTGTLTAERINQRIRQAEQCVNGNIGNSNWNANEPLANVNLEKPNALTALTWTIGDEDGDATTGEDVANGTMRRWKPAAAGDLVSFTFEFRCTTACGAADVTIEIDKGGVLVASANGTTADTVVTTAVSGVSFTADDTLSIDLNSANNTNVDFIHVTVVTSHTHQI